jgi:hypothetical protein
MLSTSGRAGLRRQTISDLAGTDWGRLPKVCLAAGGPRRPHELATAGALALLRTAVDEQCDFILFLEDDLRFNRHLRGNLRRWRPLRRASGHDFFPASLYDPGVRAERYHRDHAYFVADPACAYGSQALLLSARTAQYLIESWHTEQGLHDFRIFGLAARQSRIHYHFPTLVQHTGSPNSASGLFHAAPDFDPNWRPNQNPVSSLLSA